MLPPPSAGSFWRSVDPLDHGLDSRGRKRRRHVVRLGQEVGAADFRARHADVATSDVGAVRPVERGIDERARADRHRLRSRGIHQRLQKRLQARLASEVLSVGGDDRAAGPVGRDQVAHREEVVGRGRRPRLPGGDDCGRIAPVPGRAVGDDVAGRMRVEDEARHDAELPRPAPAARPVEVRVLCLAREERLAGSGHDDQGADVVAGQAVLAARESVTRLRA